MKRINILHIVGIFIILICVTQPAYADAWDYRNAPERFQIQLEYGASEAAHLNAAIGKFEGLFKAYAWLETPAGQKAVENQIFIAADDLGSALNELNAAVAEVYPTLSEEEQLAVENAYSSLGLYLEELAAKTNSAFGKEVLEIEHKESDKTTLGLWTVNVWTLPD